MTEFRGVREYKNVADQCQCGAKNKAGHYERIAKQIVHKHPYTGPGKHTLRNQGGGKK